MKRGEVWIGSGGGLAGKPRPVLIVQNDFIRGDSVVVCLITSDGSNQKDTKVEVEASPQNGLKRTSYVMADKIFAFRPEQLSYPIGSLNETRMTAVSKSLKKMAQSRKILSL